MHSDMQLAVHHAVLTDSCLDAPPEVTVEISVSVLLSPPKQLSCRASADDARAQETHYLEQNYGMVPGQ